MLKIAIIVGSTRPGRVGESVAEAQALALVPYFWRNRSTRPAVSISFCLPVKKGWHFEQTSTRMSGRVERVRTTSPQAHVMVVSTYSG